MFKGFKIITVNQQTCSLGAFFSITSDYSHTKANSVKDGMFSWQIPLGVCLLEMTHTLVSRSDNLPSTDSKFRVLS